MTTEEIKVMTMDLKDFGIEEWTTETDMLKNQDDLENFLLFS